MVEIRQIKITIRKNVLENLVHLSDYDVVFDPIKFPDDDTDCPWEIKTSNPDKYQRILEQTYEHVVTRSPKIKAQLKFDLGRIFLHEMDHYQIATQLGKIPLLCVGFMYDFETNKIVPEFSTLTYEGKSPTTKLQLAAISAMPNDALNHSDLRDLQIMGYSGRLDVRKRISRHNTLYPHEPIPMIK